jgi:hypothetical protein
VPAANVSENWSGFATNRLSKIPAPGVHPRILLSPGDLPDLRRRLKATETGRKLYTNLQSRLADALQNPNEWGGKLYERLAAGDVNGAKALLDEHKGLPAQVGHYQPWIYVLVMESFDALVADDAVRGKKVATALATYAKIISPLVDSQLKQPLADDVWRAKVAGPTTGDWSSNQGIRDLVAYHNLGYAYDFAYNFMTDAQRAEVRGVIAKVTNGRIWLGASLPHHFRNWNWCAVGLGQPLLALAIEGEEGYDPRVFKLGVQIARDYLTYAISEKGSSTEAVGYTQFGFVWADPFMVAAARRGENLLVQNHHRAMLDWYLQTMQPFAPALINAANTGDAEQRQRGLSPIWVSHGDGGDEGPSIWTMTMWKYFFPADAKIDFLWQNVVKPGGDGLAVGKFHIIEPLVFAEDGIKDAKDKPVDYASGAKLNPPLTWFDPARGSLIARNEWTPDTLALQFECRTDSVGSSHEHSDRGMFTVTAQGRSWAKDNFRSVETRHHNNVLIDGAGQGVWPGPGKWLGLQDDGAVVIAACDTKDAYDWWWPKEVLTEPTNFVRFEFPRWDSYRDQIKQFQKNYGDLPLERDPRPAVVAHWKGFEQHDPRMWDEDGWPMRLPHNPVQRAFRTVALARGAKPFVLVVDDIQKDNQERLYEWLMQTGPDTEMVSLMGNDIVLCDATVKRDDNGVVKPAKGDRELLVRVLRMNDPEKFRDYQSRPSLRLETFERKDTLVPEMKAGSLSGSRSFGLDKRLVIASRSVSPDFVILLFPLRHGDELPVTTWNADKTKLTVKTGGDQKVFTLKRDAAGRTQLAAD